jgi:hypothetical protein
MLDQAHSARIATPNLLDSANGSARFRAKTKRTREIEELTIVATVSMKSHNDPIQDLT